MQTEIIIGLLSLLGTLIGSVTGIMAANRLTNYRISQLEKRVEKHNHLVERTYKIEEDVAILNNRQKVSEHRIEDLERERGEGV